MLRKKQFSWIIWSKEVVLVIILDLLFHVLFKSMGVFVEDLLENVVDLKKMTTWSAEIWLILIKTVWLDKVLLKDADNITLEDNFGVNFILEFFQGLILLSLFPGKSSLFSS